MKGNLCKVLVISFLFNLGLIKNNDNMSCYLPDHLSKHGGSWNICKRIFGCNNEYVAKYYINDFAKKTMC